jgi:hypothetical protein
MKSTFMAVVTAFSISSIGHSAIVVKQTVHDIQFSLNRAYFVFLDPESVTQPQSFTADFSKSDTFSIHIEAPTGYKFFVSALNMPRLDVEWLSYNNYDSREDEIIFNQTGSVSFYGASEPLNYTIGGDTFAYNNVSNYLTLSGTTSELPTSFSFTGFSFTWGYDSSVFQPGNIEYIPSEGGIAFNVQGIGFAQGWMTIEQIPEPSIALLMLLSLTGILMRTRRIVQPATSGGVCGVNRN